MEACILVRLHTSCLNRWLHGWVTHMEMIYRVLVFLDRVLSTILGRPCAISEEEYVVLLTLHLRPHFELTARMRIRMQLRRRPPGGMRRRVLDAPYQSRIGVQTAAGEAVGGLLFLGCDQVELYTGFGAEDCCKSPASVIYMRRKLFIVVDESSHGWMIVLVEQVKVYA